MKTFFKNIFQFLMLFLGIQAASTIFILAMANARSAYMGILFLIFVILCLPAWMIFRRRNKEQKFLSTPFVGETFSWHDWVDILAFVGFTQQIVYWGLYAALELGVILPLSHWGDDYAKLPCWLDVLSFGVCGGFWMIFNACAFVLWMFQKRKIAFWILLLSCSIFSMVFFFFMIATMCC